MRREGEGAAGWREPGNANYLAAFVNGFP